MTHDHPTAPDPEQPPSGTSPQPSDVPPASDAQDTIAPIDAASVPSADEPDADEPDADTLSPAVLSPAVEEPTAADPVDSVSAVKKPIAAADAADSAAPTAAQLDAKGIGAGATPAAADAAAKPPTSPAASRSQAFVRLVRQLWGIVLALVPVIVTLAGRIWQLLLVLLKWVRSTWAALLPKLRPILPEPFKTRLPDAAVTTTAIVLLVLAVWVPTALFSRAPAAEVSDRPSPVVSPAPPSPAIAPEKIVAIQTQMTEISDRYAQSLIQAVDADPSRSRLNVALGVGWYGLESALQDQFANDVLKQSTELKFAKLDMVDQEETLVARSPVIGSRMIVLQRVASPALQEELEKQLEAARQLQLEKQREIEAAERKALEAKEAETKPEPTAM